MPVNRTHAEYDATAPAWSRARDVLAGEDAVKAAGDKYLPRLDSQSEEEYAAYKARASFFGATARTLAEYLDLIFRRGPVVAVDERKALEQFVSDCDLEGMDFVRYARQVVSEVLSVGRGGSLELPGGLGCGSAGEAGGAAGGVTVRAYLGRGSSPVLDDSDRAKHRNTVPVCLLSLCILLENPRA